MRLPARPTPSGSSRIIDRVTDLPAWLIQAGLTREVGVVMTRRPDVFVRSLSMEEDRKLQRITRTAKDSVKLRRAIVVLMSGQGQAMRDITSLLQVSADYVRDVIHAFNERGSMRWTQMERGTTAEDR